MATTHLSTGTGCALRPESFSVLRLLAGEVTKPSCRMHRKENSPRDRTNSQQVVVGSPKSFGDVSVRQMLDSARTAESVSVLGPLSCGKFFVTGIKVKEQALLADDAPATFCQRPALLHRCNVCQTDPRPRQIRGGVFHQTQSTEGASCSKLCS